MINNRTGLNQQIHEKLVEPARRQQMLPDMGTASLAKTGSKYHYGSTNVIVEGFWEGMVRAVAGSTIGNFFVNIFNPTGLAQDEIIVDLMLRTPSGNKLFPSLPLTVNGIDDKSGLNEYLKSGHTLAVKVTFDGGRPSECTPVAWRVDHPTVDQAQASGALTSTNITVENGVAQIVGTTGTAGPSDSSLPFIVDLQHTSLKRFAAIPGDPRGGIYVNDLNAAGDMLRMDPNLIAGIIDTESSWKNYQVSNGSGATGLTQFLPSTFHGVYASLVKQYPQVAGLPDDPHCGASAIFCCTLYMKNLLDEFNGVYEQAIAAYNSGPGAVQTAMKTTGHWTTFSETEAYVPKVVAAWGFFTQRSKRLNSSKILVRPEVFKQETTMAHQQSGQAVVHGGGL